MAGGGLEAFHTSVRVILLHAAIDYSSTSSENNDYFS